MDTKQLKGQTASVYNGDYHEGFCKITSLTDVSPAWSYKLTGVNEYRVYVNVRIPEHGVNQRWITAYENTETGEVHAMTVHRDELND